MTPDTSGLQDQMKQQQQQEQDEQDEQQQQAYKQFQLQKKSTYGSSSLGTSLGTAGGGTSQSSTLGQ